MINLTYEQKTSLGFQYILDSLSPNCIYGQELVKQARPFEKSQEKELKEEQQRLCALVEGYEANKGIWDKAELILMQMNEVRGALKRGQELILTDLELFELKKFLLQCEKLEQLFSQHRELQLPGLVLHDTREALDILDVEKRRMPGFYIADAYAQDLREVRERKKHFEVVLRQEHSEERREELLKLRGEMVAMEEAIQQRVRQEITERLRPWFDDVLENCSLAGRLDFLLQKTKAALTYHGICPVMTEDTLLLKDMTNPLLVDRLKESGKTFSPISFQMKQGTTVITGANMGGKSVALRTIALNVVLAQSGFFIYAKQGQVPMFDSICLIAEEYQAMENGLSSFGGEIMELQRALEQQKQGFSLLIFDELARGTNPDEGSLIVKAVIKYLKEKQAMVIVATHYDHIAEYAHNHYQVIGLKNADLAKMQEEIHAGGSKGGIDIISRYMDYGIYQVQNQQECPRDAIHICGLLGLEPELMKYITE